MKLLASVNETHKGLMVLAGVAVAIWGFASVQLPGKALRTVEAQRIRIDSLEASQTRLEGSMRHLQLKADSSLSIVRKLWCVTQAEGTPRLLVECARQ